MERPTGVTILAVLAFIFAGLAVLCALGLMFMGGMIAQMMESSGMGTMLAGVGAFAGIVVLVAAALYFLVGFGLWKLKNWGRILAIVFVALGLISAALGLFSSLSPFQTGVFVWQLFVCALDIWIIVYLLKPHVKQAFS